MYNSPKVVLSSGIIMLLFVVSSISLASASLVMSSSDDLAGPFLDSLTYRKVGSLDELPDQLQSGSIDAILNEYDPNSDLATYNEFVSSEDTSVSPRYRNGYGYMVLNTLSYPLNYTVLRRAIAFGVNKTEICAEVWDGLASPQDSPVPLANPYCVENILPFHYYDANFDAGNQILDTAGFTTHTGETYRRTPEGDAFDITIEVAQSSPVAIGCGEIFGQALEGLHINHSIFVTDFYASLNRIYAHSGWDCIFMGQSLSDDSLSWLLNYESGYAANGYVNFPGFMNSSYDSYCQQLDSADYNEFLEATYQMQLILAYECPIIPMYCNYVGFSAYRTDEFQGFINNPRNGVTNRLTYETLHQNNGDMYGGNYEIGFSDTINTLNFMLADSEVEKNVLANLYDSLMRLDSNGQYIPWIAESVKTQTYSDNSSVPIGYTQLVIDIRDDVLWSDGSSLTADDVSYTFLYYHNSIGNPYGQGLEDLKSAYSVSPTRVYLVFDSDSFWDFRSVLTKPIISKLEFSPIGYDGWDSWDPSSSPGSMRITGPFRITYYDPANRVELSVNPYYFAIPGPSISHPEDLTITSSQVGANITWHCDSRNPESYDLYRNGTWITSETWNGSDIVVSLSSLDSGVYEYELVVRDTLGKSAHDTVFVTVVAPAGFPDLLNPSILITLGSLAVIIAVIALIIRNRRT